MNIFDNNLKKKLQDAELPVSEGIWENIEAQIPVKQDKPKYWMLFLVTLFALPFLIYPLTTSDTQNAEGQEKILKEVDTKSETLNQKNTSYSNNASSNNSSVNDHSSIVSESSSDSNSDSNNTELSSLDISELRLSLGNDNNLEFQSNTGTAFSIERNRLAELSESRVSKRSAGTSNTRLNTDVATLRNLDSNLLKESSTSSSKKLKFLRKPFTDNLDLDNTGNGFKLIEKSRIFQKASKLKNIPLIDGSVVPQFAALEYDRQKDIGKRLLGLRKASPICPSFKSFSSGIYLFTDVRASLSSQQLENKSGNPEVDNIISQRNVAETSAISSSFNIGVGKKWGSGILVESGFNLDVITTNLRFLQPGKTIIVIDSMPPISMDTMTTPPHMVNSKNKFRQINIPVNLGYEYRISERYSIAAKAGVLINLASSNSGQVLTETGLVTYDSSDRINNIFKTNLNLSYSGGIDLISDISRNFSGYIGLNVNYYPDDFSLRTFAVRQSYYKYGVTAGLRYRI